MAMLTSIWRKITGKNSTPSAKTEPLTLASNGRRFASAARSQSSRVTPAAQSLADNYRPLWQLLTSRQILEVKIVGSSLSYQTVILAIDIQRGLIWLDDLFPAQRALGIGDLVTLRHHHNGNELMLCSPLVAWGDSYGATGFAIVLPDSSDIAYLPRRKYRRAYMSDTPSLAIKIRPIGQEVSYGTVLDISTGGLRLSVPNNLLGQLRHGALLPLCELHLSDEFPIRCTARVRGFRLLRTPYRHTQISLEFLDIPHERQQLLEQFINNLFYLQASTNSREAYA